MAKYGIREICDVVFKAKKNGQKVGSKSFLKGQPVIYFDTLKTSSLEGAATTVYATGGKGNPRLVAWDGERTLTFNMEDALISPMGLAILTGAGLITAGDENAKIVRHVTERVMPIATTEEEGETTYTYYLTKKPVVGNTETVDNITFIPNVWVAGIDSEGNAKETESVSAFTVAEDKDNGKFKITALTSNGEVAMTTGEVIVFDYYTEETTSGAATQVDIEPGKFSGSFYIEGSTLWRDTDGADHPVEIVIPNGKVQSNFTFTMANSGDPSTFNFVVDALADYTEFDKTKKVLAAMQIMEETV